MGARLCVTCCLLLLPTAALAEPLARGDARIDQLRLASVPLPGSADEVVVHPGQALEVFLSPSDFPDAFVRLVLDDEAAVYAVNLDETALVGEAVPSRVRWPRLDDRPLAVTAPADVLPLESPASQPQPTLEELTDPGATLEWYLRPHESETDGAELHATVHAVRLVSSGGRTLLAWSAPGAPPPCGEAPRGQPRCRIPGPSRAVTSLAVHPTGRWVAVAGGDLRPRIDLWSGSPLTLVRRLAVPPWSGPPVRLEFTPDGQALIAADAEGTVHFFEADTGGGHRIVGRRARSFILLDAGRSVVAADAEGGLTVWRTRDGTIDARIGHQAHGPGPLLAASGDGLRVAALSSDEEHASVVVWELEQERLVGQIVATELGVVALALDAEGEHVMAVHDRQGLLRYRVGGEARFAPWGGADGRRCRGELALSPDRSLLACVTSEPGVAVFDALRGRLLQTLSTGDEEPLSALAFGADGARLVATAGGDLLEWSLDLSGGGPR